MNRAKDVLAYEVTRRVHGDAEADRARQTSRAAFGGGKTDVDAMPSITVSADEINAGVGVIDLFSRTDLCTSRGEARRLVLQGGAYINDVAVEDLETAVGRDDVRSGQILLRAGKKRYFRVVVGS
jgi:tyrosyl-tRNA synthetase